MIDLFAVTQLILETRVYSLTRWFSGETVYEKNEYVTDIFVSDTC